MAGFDDPGVFFSDAVTANEGELGPDGSAGLVRLQTRFRDFIRQFHEGHFDYKYRYAFHQLSFLTDS